VKETQRSMPGVTELTQFLGRVCFLNRGRPDLIMNFINTMFQSEANA
jgi:hypothetical protein